MARRRGGSRWRGNQVHGREWRPWQLPVKGETDGDEKENGEGAEKGEAEAEGKGKAEKEKDAKAAGGVAEGGEVQQESDSPTT